MNSMTGYGWGDCTRHGYKVTVEISSVNRKQGEVSVALPRELEVLEAQMREAVHAAITRGRLTVRVAVQTVAGQEEHLVHLNRPLARAYATALERLARELKLSGGVTLEALLRAPGVLQSEATTANAERYWPAVKASLDRALLRLLTMRRKEGRCLQRDLTRRVTAMRRATARIRRRAPKVLQRYRAQLMERMSQAGLDPAVLDEERWAKEIVLFTDRSDVSEELARLDSHFQQFDSFQSSREPVGRTLDFLAQEMNREINTIGSKANDSAISREVVTLKTELEKFREQAQNVE